MSIASLEKFAPAIYPPVNPNMLLSSAIKKVVCCVLGPIGSNTEQAATLWLERNGLTHKGKVVLRNTPEECLELALSITEKGVIAVFWTCAVYSQLNEIFFGNPDVFPFCFSQVMSLDNMLLAAKPNIAAYLKGQNTVPSGWTIASHPSSAPLVKSTGCLVVFQNSNAAAAQACAMSETDLCITTETARKLNGLVEIHLFGSPDMPFFGGITQHGFRQLMEIRGAESLMSL